MLKKIKKSRSEGFTIIEVMIVLAIAALILLIVLLAVPALQRNSRNTQRKDEAGQIDSSISNFISNNNGALPTSTNFANAIADAKLNQYDPSHVYIGTTAQSIPTTAASGGNGNSTTLTTEDVIYIPQAVCSGTTATRTGASNRSWVIIYAVESGSGNATPQCIGS